MRINFNTDEYLDISVAQKGTAGIPYDCALEVSLKSNSFSGCSTSWIEGLELKGFLNELENLDKTLKGKANLVSESPDELDIEIKPVDSVGHFVFLIKIGEKKYIESELFESSISNAFPLESQEVSNICVKLISYFKDTLEAKSFFTLSTFKSLKDKQT